MVLIEEDLSYTKDHVWVRVEGDLFVIGITDFAQEQLGEIVYVDIPSEGDEITKDEVFGSVESLKSVTDIYAPVSGEVVSANPKLVEFPQVINEDPYGEGWLIKVRPYNPDEIYDLVDSDEYKALLDEEAEA
jgi:glycine cleavage system H protein